MGRGQSACRIGVNEDADAVVFLNVLVVILDDFPIELLVLHEQLLHLQHLPEGRTVLGGLLPLPSLLACLRTCLVPVSARSESVDEGFIVLGGDDGEGVLLDGEDLVIGMSFAW